MADKREIQRKNHPKKGSRITVDPIRDQKDIATIKKLLADRPADFAFFIIGLNTGLRASDILGLRVGQFSDVRPGDEITVREKKTKKDRKITLNKSVISAARKLTEAKKAKYENGDAYLFTGQRGVWSVPYVSQKVKGWCKAVNLKGNYGSHTLRKTWGYHQRVTFGEALSELMSCLNHSSQKQTLKYLCIQDEEIRSIYMNEL